MIDLFLEATLGTSGAKALRKAVQRAPALETVLVPRTLCAWLNTAIRTEFEGQIPGIVNSYLELCKSAEDSYSGAVTIGDYVHVFDGNTLLNVAAALAVSMGVQAPDGDIRGPELSALGKSLDLLVRAKVLSEALGDNLEKAMELPQEHSADIGAKYQTLHGADHIKTTKLASGMFHHVFQAPHQSEAVFHQLSFHENPNQQSVAQIHGIQEPGEPYKVGFSQVHPDYKGKGMGRQLYLAALQHHGSMASDNFVSGGAHKAWQHLSSQPGVSVKFGTPGTQEPHVATMQSVQKVEAPGQAAPPGAPKKPEAPEVPVASQPKQGPKNVAKREITMKAINLGARCRDCGDSQFQGHLFTGCRCLKSLAKSICVKTVGSQEFLEFGPSLDQDEVEAVLAMVRL